MPDVALYNMQGNEVGTLSLPDSVFGVEPNMGLIHQAVTTEEANQRSGTADTKTRGEVRGGGRKPWRQKGTGRARQGSIRSPQWRKGGIVFGPHPRSYVKALPRAMRHSAVRSALSAKVADGELFGIESLFIDGTTPSTRIAAATLKALPLMRDVRTKHFEDNERVVGSRKELHRVLLIVPEYDETLLKSVRNLPNVTLRYAPNFSVRDVVSAGRVVLAQGAVARIEEALTRPGMSAPAAQAEEAPVIEEKPITAKRARAAKADSIESTQAMGSTESTESIEALEPGEPLMATESPESTDSLESTESQESPESTESTESNEEARAE